MSKDIVVGKSRPSASSLKEERKSTSVSERNIEILMAVAKGDKSQVMVVVEKHKKVVHDLGSVSGLKTSIQIVDG